MQNLFTVSLLMNTCDSLPPKSVADCHIANDVHDALGTVFDNYYVLPEHAAGITAVQRLQTAFDVAWKRLKLLLQSGWQHAVALSQTWGRIAIAFGEAGRQVRSSAPVIVANGATVSGAEYDGVMFPFSLAGIVA